MSAAEKRLPFELIPIDRIHESPLNPRKVFDEKALGELAKGIAAVGVLQPVKVRPLKVAGSAKASADFELVFGHRRLRASKLAGRTEIPAIVADLSDEQVLVEQLQENGPREDFHPLEEADGIHRLHTQFGLSIPEIAKRLELDESSVYARLKLCALGPVAREALRKDEITFSHGIELAKIADPKLQAQATREVIEGDGDGDKLTVRQTKEHITRHYLLELAKAPFDTTDAKLIPKAGACTSCPKRSGAQPELFGPKPTEMCTDLPCFTRKKDAHWARTVAEAKRSGREVLSEEETAKVFPEGWGGQLHHAAPYVTLDTRIPEDPKGRTLKQLLGAGAPTVLARDPRGEARELIRKDQVPKLLEQAGHDFTQKVKRDDPHAEDQRRREREAKRMRGVAVEALGRIVKAHQEIPLTGDDFWRFLFRIMRVSSDADRIVAKRRGLVDNGDREGATAAIEAAVKKLSGGELQALIVELLLATDTQISSWSLEYSEALATACDFYDVDLSGLNEESKKEARDAASGKGAKGKAAGLVKCRGFPLGSCDLRIPSTTENGLCGRCAGADAKAIADAKKNGLRGKPADPTECIGYDGRVGKACSGTPSKKSGRCPTCRTRQAYIEKARRESASA